jgi:hypothetical protein
VKRISPLLGWPGGILGAVWPGPGRKRGILGAGFGPFFRLPGTSQAHRSSPYSL